MSFLSYAKIVATGWHKLAPAKFESEQNECSKNVNYDGMTVKEIGPWPECIFRSLLQFLVTDAYMRQ